MRGIRTLSVPGIALACSLAPWIAELEGAAGTLPAGARPARTGSYRACTDILPPGVIADTSRHPLSTKLRRFLEAQPRVRGFRQTGLSGRDYLAVIDAQVAVFRKHQDAVGAIIDPIEKIEWQYSTPCYAL